MPDAGLVYFNGGFIRLPGASCFIWTVVLFWMPGRFTSIVFQIRDAPEESFGPGALEASNLNIED